MFKVGKKNTDKGTTRVDEMFAHPSPTYSPFTRPVNNDDREFMLKAMRGSNSGVEFLLSPEPQPDAIPSVNTFDSILKMVDGVQDQISNILSISVNLE